MSGTAPMPGFEGLEHLLPLLAQLTTALAPLKVRASLGTKADAEASVEPHCVWYEAPDDHWTFDPQPAVQPDDGDASLGYNERWLVSVCMPTRAALRRAVFAIPVKLIDLLGPLAVQVKATKPSAVGDGAAAPVHKSLLSVVLRGPVYREYWAEHQPATITVKSKLIGADGDTGSPAPLPDIVIKD